MTGNGIYAPPPEGHGEGAVGAAYVTASAILFGTMPFFAMTAYAYGFTPYTAAFGRCLVGGLLLLAAFGRMPRSEMHLSKAEFFQLLGLSLAYAAMMVMLYASYARIASGMATMLHFTYPIFVIALTAIVKRRGIRPRYSACALLCGAGMFLLSSPEKGEAGLDGMMLAVASGLAYALYIIGYENSRVRRLSPFALTFYLAVFSATELGAFLLVTGRWQFPETVEGWGVILLLALFTTVLGIAFFQKGMALCGGIRASLLSTMEPVTGVIIGLLAFHEIMTPRLGFGMALIMLSLFLIFARKPVGANGERSLS